MVVVRVRAAANELRRSVHETGDNDRLASDTGFTYHHAHEILNT